MHWRDLFQIQKNQLPPLNRAEKKKTFAKNRKASVSYLRTFKGFECYVK